MTDVSLAAKLYAIAQELTLQGVKGDTAKLDIALSELAAAIRGVDSKTLTDIWNELAATLSVSDSTSHTALAAILTALGPLATAANQSAANTSLSSIDNGIGGASAAAAGNTGASTTNGFLRWLRDKLYAVSPSSWLVVGGAAAVGQAPAANPVGTSGVDANGLKRAIRTDDAGRQEIITRSSQLSSSTIASGTDTVVAAVPQGAQSVAFFIPAGNLSATVTFAFSIDGGITYPFPMYAKRMDSFAAPQNSMTMTGAGVTQALGAAIPVAATHVRIAPSAYTSGSATAYIGFSSSTIFDFAGVITTLSAGTNRIGSMQRAAVWTRESTTPVNAALSITGAAKTTFNTSSGTALNTSTSYGSAFAAAAGADVAGTLIIEASPDSGTTWYPVASAALAQIGGSGNFGVYLETPICEATMRGRLLNGASNQARAFLTTRMIG